MTLEEALDEVKRKLATGTMHRWTKSITGFKALLTISEAIRDGDLIAKDAAEQTRLRAKVEAADKLAEALMDIADPKRLQSHGDPVVLRDRARAALGDAG